MPKPISESATEHQRSSRLLFLGLILILGGCASLSFDNANTAQLADTATTGAGVAAGLQEVNPIMAPMANGGPVGLAIMAGIKLGFNQIGKHQDPPVCREWLSISAAAGWAAAASNIAMMMAPPLAVMALPIFLQTYRLIHNGSSLNSCYKGMMADVILRTPLHTELLQMPRNMREDLLTVVGVWPNPEFMEGTRAVQGTKLVHALMIDEFESMEQFIARYSLDWSVIGMQDQEGNDIVPLELAILDLYMPRDQQVQSGEKRERTVIRKHDGSVWKSSTETRLVSNK